MITHCFTQAQAIKELRYEAKKLNMTFRLRSDSKLWVLVNRKTGGHIADFTNVWNCYHSFQQGYFNCLAEKYGLI